MDPDKLAILILRNALSYILGAAEMGAVQGSTLDGRICVVAQDALRKTKAA